MFADSKCLSFIIAFGYLWAGCVCRGGRGDVQMKGIYFAEMKRLNAHYHATEGHFWDRFAAAMQLRGKNKPLVMKVDGPVLPRVAWNHRTFKKSGSLMGGVENKDRFKRRSLQRPRPGYDRRAFLCSWSGDGHLEAFRGVRKKDFGVSLISCSSSPSRAP